MLNGDILILRGEEVSALLGGQEQSLIKAVRAAYEAHAAGSSSLPHSTFLRFPDDQRNRIIALPAYLGAEFELAGMKWISSFPGNLARELDRASAVVVLNSSQTGKPFAILEGSIISAKRTAASAALAAASLSPAGELQRLGLIGCGVINYEILRFLLAAPVELQRSVTLFDIDLERAHQFERKCRQLSADLSVEIAPDVPSLLGRSTLVSFATTAVKPYLSDLSVCPPGATSSTTLSQERMASGVRSRTSAVLRPPSTWPNSSSATATSSAAPWPT
jgi:N-[(2S)-2-amino-2-carboxyethyl]-L-glutamate dehydrogenase